MNRLKFYQRLTLVSGLVLALLNHFAFGFLAFLVPFAKADTITWVGPSFGYWEEPTNWSGGEIPTALDNVVIDLTSNGPVVATSTINFASLSLLNMNKDFNGAFVLLGTIGSGGDITLSGLDEEPGNFSFTSPQTISGTLTVEEGGGLAAFYMSTSSPITPISFTAQNIDIQAGGYVTLRALGSGFLGGVASSTGQGPGGGIFGTGPNGSGGGHAGNGGMDAQGDLGGGGYCDFEDPDTLGSGGAGSGSEESNNNAEGGKHLKLEAVEEIIINGRIESSGLDGDGSGNPSVDAGGGGAGGSVVLSADIISGTPQIFDVSGGDSVGSYSEGTSGEGGGGGGGCVKISYGTSNSITPDEILAHGGYGYQRGGAGTVFIHKQDDTVRQLSLSNIGNSSSTISLPAETPQVEDELSLQTLALSTSSIYTVGTGKTLILTSSTPFSGSSPSGTIKIEDGGTLKIDSDASIENVTIELHEGGEILDSATDLSTTLNFSIGQGATFDMRGFTTDTPFIVETFIADGGGVVTHGSHEGLLDTFTHMVNIQAETIEITGASSIDVSGKGFAGGIDGEDGNGPGGGEYAYGTAVGAGHGGDGTANNPDGSSAGAGGSAYCDVSNPATLGSGGSSGYFDSGTGRRGGDGGGLVWLVATSEIILSGNILADGENGSYDFYIGEIAFESISGAGAGGGVKLISPTISGHGEIFARGGSNGVDPSPEPTEYGGGSGGCILVNYVETNEVVTSSLYLAGGGLSTGVAEDGSFSIVKDNSLPQIFLNFQQPDFISNVTSTDLNSATDFVLVDDYAYVASLGSSALSVVDISSSTNPVIVGTTGSTADLAGIQALGLSGNYIFAGNTADNSFRVLDISSTTNPMIVGGIEFETAVPELLSMTLSGNYVYLVAATDGYSVLRVINVSNPLSPSVVGSITNDPDLLFPTKIVVSGNYAYVATLGGQFTVVDISSPSAPVIVGSIENDAVFDGSFAMTVSGNYAYVASNDANLIAVVDISDPSAPDMVKIVRGPVPIIGGPGQMTISENFLYAVLSGGNPGIWVIDITDPLTAHSIGYVIERDLLTSPAQIVVQGDYAYVTDFSEDSFNIFDITPSASVDPIVAFDISDTDRQELSVKAEYVAGTCTYTGVSLATFSTSTATSTYGITIDNAAGDDRRISSVILDPVSDYPVAQASTTWLASIDEGEEGEYCMFMTPYDGEDEGTRVGGTLIVDDPLLAPGTPVLSVANKTPTSITLTWAVVGGTEFYTVSSSISGIPTETTETSVTYAGLSNGTEYIFQIKATDNFDNSSDYSSTITVETETPSSGGGGTPSPPPPPYIPDTPSTTPSSTPSNPSGLILINAGAAYTNSRNVTLTFNTTFTDAYALSDSTDFTGKSFLPIIPTVPYVLSEGDGEKRIYARFSNSFGIYEAYDVILLDTQAPMVPSLTSLTSPDLILKREGLYGRRFVSSTNQITPTVSGTAEPGTRIVITITSGVEIAAQLLRLANVQTFYTPVGGDGLWSFTFPLNLDNTTYQLVLQSEDGAGNISSPSYSYFDFSVASPPPVCEGSECEPVDEPPIDEPPVDEPPVDEPPIDPVCTVNCGPEDPIDTTGDTSGESGDTGMGEPGDTTGNDTGEENTGSGSGSSDPEVENTVTDSGEGSIISNVGESAMIVAGTINTFFQEVVESISQNAAVKAVVEVAEVTVEKVEEVIDNPVVEKTNEIVVAPVIAAAAAVNVAAGGVTIFSQLMMYLRLIFSQPLLLLTRRKQKSWGVVFNGYSKQPIDLALVRLVHGESGKVLRTQVTDDKGRYFMTGGTGAYRLEATKEGFDNQKMIIDDLVYPNIYRGETLKLTEETSQLNYNIPLRPEQQDKTAAHILKEYGRATARKTTSMVGGIATVGSFIISPKPWITALLVAHVLLYSVMKRIAHKKVKGTHGVVTDESKNHISKVVVRVFDANYNKLVDTAVTDAKGRYAMLVGPSTYYVTAEKAGYEIYKSGIIDLSSEKTKGVGGVIAEPILLSKPTIASSGTDSKNYTVRTMPMM